MKSGPEGHARPGNKNRSRSGRQHHGPLHLLRTDTVMPDTGGTQQVAAIQDGVVRGMIMSALKERSPLTPLHQEDRRRISKPQEESFGSTTSRIPSPSRLKEKIASRIARPGKRDIQGAVNRLSTPVPTIAPQEAIGG